MTESIYQLPVQQLISATISRRQYDELALIVIDHPQLRAVLSLQGAQLIRWQPAGEQDVLWLSDCTPFKTGVPLRGGVPICWPWFGPASQPGLPSHGFARNLPWSLAAHQENSQGVVLTFELHSSETSHRYWPHDFTLYARFKLGQRCEIELEAHGEHSSTAALHSYLQVGDLQAVRVSGLGEQFIDKVAGGVQGLLPGGVQQFHQRTDRIYLAPDACSSIDDPQLSRIIDVIHHHHSNVVGWNPGAEGAAAMPDINPNGWQHFVCIETARIDQPLIASHHKPARLSCTLQMRRRG